MTETIIKSILLAGYGKWNKTTEHINASIAVKGNEININEESTGEISANCVCPFDLVLDACPIKDGIYSIYLKKDELKYGMAEIPFAQTAKGTVKLKPWN